MSRCGWLLCLFLLAIAWSGQAKDVATVNGIKITDADVEAAFRRSAVSRRELTPDQESLYRKHVLSILIDDTLIKSLLDEQKITPNKKKVDEHIVELTKQLQKRNETLEQFLANINIDEAKMREELTSIYRWLDYVDTRANSETLQKYFESNRDAFDGSEVRASHILVKVASAATPEQKLAAKDKIQKLRDQISAGSPFAEVAKASSDCPSKANGGDLDFFPRKDVMTEPFAAAAFSLKNGQVSEIIETEFGYHLILVTDRKPGKAVNFKEITDDVRAHYAADLRQSLVTQLRQKADIKYLP